MYYSYAFNDTVHYKNTHVHMPTSFLDIHIKVEKILI